MSRIVVAGDSGGYYLCLTQHIRALKEQHLGLLALTPSNFCTAAHIFHIGNPITA